MQGQHMAYSNWGAFVYRNGERRPDKEDVGVFDTDEADLPSGARIFANIMKRRAQENTAPWTASHHAVLGDGPVRVCGYKHEPSLWVWRDDHGEQVALPQPDDTTDQWDLEDQGGTVEVDGQSWRWWFNQYNGNMIDLQLIEPDGTTWTATCGYCYGAGWME